MKLVENLCLCILCGLFALSCQDDTEPKAAPPNPDDPYAGEQYIITLKDETEDFRYNEFNCFLQAEDGTIFKRKGDHLRLDGKSVLTFETGLKDGIYRLLYLQAPSISGSDTTWIEYGLGCRVQLSATDTTRILDAYSKVVRLSGNGTVDAPFIVSCSDHLKRIRDLTNDQIKNSLLFPNTHFLQVADIDMDKASWDSDHQFGWVAIGNLPNNPFRGIYDGGDYTISNAWSLRNQSAGIGLFGYTEKAILKHIRMENPRMEGNFGVGALVGATTSAGDSRDQTSLFSCRTTGGYVKAGDGSMGAGGLVGVVDMYGMLLLDSCTNGGTSVSGAYGIGGLLGAGAIYSQSYLQQCENHASVTSDYTGAGGLVGSVDSLFVIGCLNTGKIIGSQSYNGSDANNGGYGTGGIAGGTGMSFIYSSTNAGVVEGAVGVGGIIGSTRTGAEELTFNNTLVKSCGNTGAVSGQSSIGGICGEAQFGCYAVYNIADVTATATSSFAGGIAGNTSIAVVHNALNTGKVTARNAESVGGVVGKTTWGAFFASQNFGDMEVDANYAGGLVGLAGNYTMVNYCSNMGYIHNSGSGPTGGLIGEIGDPREWSAMNIASCVIGSVECVLGVLGPVISISGKALKEATTTTGKALKQIAKVLHVAETAADWALMATDKVLLRVGIAEMLTEEEAKIVQASLQTNVSVIDGGIRSRMESIRSGYSLANDLLPTGLNVGIASKSMDNLNTVLAFYEASEDNNNTINFNINHNREERYEQIEDEKKTKEIIQKVIAGTCVCVASVAGVASGIVTGGTTAAATITLIGTVATVIGGANAIVEGATDFQNNAVIISQCVNLGTIQADNSKFVGGITGHLQQYCIIRDCLNGGKIKGSNKSAGAIAGKSDSRSEITRCLNVGSSWYSNTCYYEGDFILVNDNYYYNSEGEQLDRGFYLSIDELYRSSSYKGWDINKDGSIWQLNESKGYFPVPYRSEMEEEIKEHT